MSFNLANYERHKVCKCWQAQSLGWNNFVACFSSRKRANTESCNVPGSLYFCVFWLVFVFVWNVLPLNVFWCSSRPLKPPDSASSHIVFLLNFSKTQSLVFERHVSMTALSPPLPPRCVVKVASNRPFIPQWSFHSNALYIAPSSFPWRVGYKLNSGQISRSWRSSSRIYGLKTFSSRIFNSWVFSYCNNVLTLILI